MKKLFISCPMRGRTEKNIRKTREKMHKIAEAIFEQELEVIESYIDGRPQENAKEKIWYLGKAIQMMSEADYFIGVEYPYDFKGCMIENEVAARYEIERMYVRMEAVAPDAIERVGEAEKRCG